MDEFLDDISTYARSRGLAPSTVIQRAVNGSGRRWSLWVSGASSPTVRTVDLIRKYMRENPVSAPAAEVSP